MSDLNDPLKDSYIGKVADALAPYVDELKAKGFDPASRIDQLTKAGPLIEGAIKLRKVADQAASDAGKNERGVRGQFYDLAPEACGLPPPRFGNGAERTQTAAHLFLPSTGAIAA